MPNRIAFDRFLPVSRGNGVRSWKSHAMIGLLLMLCAGSLVSCNFEEPGVKKITIGFSQCTGDSNWRKATLDALDRELAFHPGAELIYKNAGDNNELQVEQIRQLAASGIDILLVSPNEAAPLTAVVEEVYQKGIPVIVVDRKINSNQFTCYVGTDNYSIGRMAGEYILNKFPGKVNIIEITGLKGSTPTSERSRGFYESLVGQDRVHVKASIEGKWLKADAAAALLNIKDSLASDDIIFAQNDPMIIGAYAVYKDLGFEKSARFIGVDGLPGPDGGIQLVADKILEATLLNPTGGEEAIQTAFKILNQEPVDREIILSTVVIDASNVRILKLQTDKIAGLQKDIENQVSLLANQKRLYQNQHVVLYVQAAALVLVIGFGALLYFALRRNRAANRKLAIQNATILQQRNHLIDLTAKANEATEAKFNFFTNISHELRTPLTLIQGPLEDSLATRSLPHQHRNNLELARKNVYRLLRLVNQLLDFRKIELRKMKVHATENNIVDYIREITESFKETARRKEIRLKFLPQGSDILLWFDVSMMDKILLNLLSNAFKFTGENGQILLSVGYAADRQSVRIKIQDTGAGMTADAAAHAFDLFYEGHELSPNSSGLGLALCKELVELHHGTIAVSSEKWKGACFELNFPVGNGHFSADELETERIIHHHAPDFAQYITDTAPVVEMPEQQEAGPEKSHSVLVIEDNPDLRFFLKEKLGRQFEVHEAANGVAALDAAFELIPDLIICDLMLPGSDGLSVTNTLKTDSRTAHIPIVLLSAKDGLPQLIEGMKNRADAFIGKPFDFSYLEATLNSLLVNREILKEHYTSELPLHMQTNASQKTDRKFINAFTAIVAANISNEQFGPEDIARELHLSRMQLYRKVKNLVGYNVNDYILLVRLQKAKYLLLHETSSIADIAFQTGFSSPAYFSTVFKAKFSITPSEYRERKE